MLRSRILQFFEILFCNTSKFNLDDMQAFSVNAYCAVGIPALDAEQD